MTVPVEPTTPANPLAILRQLEWRVRHAVENVLSGEYRSTFRGRGMEFDQVVKYEFGDDVRDIDWNVTARLGEPYRKKFVEEREVTLLLVFEDSPDMEQFIRNLFGSIAVKNINVHEKSDSKIAYVTVDEQDRGNAIGRNGDRIKVGRSLLQRRFGCDLRLVSK